MKSAALCFLLIICLIPAYAQLTYTSIDYPGGDGTWIRGINNHGDMVGAYLLWYSGHHALLVQNGQFIPLAPTSILGTGFSDAFKINDRGDVVGEVCDDFACHGFLYSNGTVTQLDYPGASDTWATGISEQGTVTGLGDFYDADGNYVSTHDFLWNRGVYTDVHVPGADTTSVSDINARGDFIGIWSKFSEDPASHGYLYTKVWYISLNAPFPGIIQTQPNGLNASDKVVGSCRDAEGWSYAFLWANNKFTQLNYYDAIKGTALQTTAWGINSAGRVVGNWYDFDFNVHGWMAVPNNKSKAAAVGSHPPIHGPASTKLSKAPFNPE